jgi:CHAD domain-containing protein
MAEGKWISGLTPELPATEAARRVLQARLDAVPHHLAPAVERPDEDPEHVHQLRVATRRAAAALEIFADFLSKKTLRRTRRKLRDLRRAAGAVRDWDVFLIELTARTRGRQNAGGDFLRGYGFGQRAVALDELRAAAPKSAAEFAEDLAQVSSVVRPPDDCADTLIDLTRPLLAKLLDELHAAARGDLTDYRHLHRVRIRGKELRYAMEVFADCFPPTFRDELYAAVEEMQDILGRANDSHVAIGRLTALKASLRASRPEDWPRYRAALDSLVRYHRGRLPRERQHFLRWWRHWLESGLDGRLVALLQPGGPSASIDRDAV